MGPSATTRADPVTSSPRPWVESVSSPKGSTSVRTARAPSPRTSRFRATSTTDSAAMGSPSWSKKWKEGRIGSIPMFTITNSEVMEDPLAKWAKSRASGSHTVSGRGDRMSV